MTVDIPQAPTDAEPNANAGVSCTRRYVVITPCRNEAEYLPITIESMVNQTIVPDLWLIVDDGSTDATPEMVKQAAKEHPWIRLYRRVDRGRRAVGGGVVEAFNEGLAQIDLDDYDYLCKLDADLGIPENYFESVIKEMEKDPLVGNFSGKTYINPSCEKWVSERMGDENAIGPAKFYRVQCFRDIGGFVQQASWDGIDGHRCRMCGWIAGSTDRPDLILKHYRPQGSSQKSIWTGRKRWGRGKYFMGSSLLYVLAVGAYRSVEYPYVVGGVGIVCGYIGAALSGAPRYDDKEYLRHFRKYEMRGLLTGKRRTLLKHNASIREQARRANDPRLFHPHRGVTSEGSGS